MSIQKYSQPVVKGLKDVVQFVNLHKIKAISSLSIVAMLATGAFAGNNYYKSNLVDVYHVYFHGAEIGVVDSPRVVETWLKDKMSTESDQFQGFDLEMNSDVTYEHQTVYKGTFDNESTLDVLANSVEVKAKAFKLIINGEMYGYVKDQAAGEAILNELTKKYTEPYDKKNTVAVASLLDDDYVLALEEENDEDAEKLKSVSIKEQVSFVPTIIDPEEMTEEESIVSALSEVEQQQQTYTVQKGDYLGKIAIKLDMKTSDLLKLNPGLTEKSILQIGQELIVTGIESKITVQTVVEQKKIEAVNYPVEYIDDKSMYKNEKKTKQKGVKGEKKVTYEVIKENGIEVDRVALEEVILKEPVKEIIIQGTKPVPVASTGKFIWPTKGGTVTSNYGWRWGRMHNGIDIAGVKDKTIMAADNGTVTFAGWKKSFGNLVIIKHSDGYETYYAHLSSISVKKDQKVAQGQKIGVMGSTGNSTGVHLHFEIRKDGKPTNPSKAFK